MPRETFVQKQARAQQVCAALQRTYPDAHCELDHQNALQLLIATILSAQCTDKRVNQVTPSLFAEYPSAAHFANAELAQLEERIKPTGFFRNKSKSIQSCCRALVEHHQGEVPRTMDELTALGGVGRKTANVVLSNAFNIHVGVVVDTHVTRLSWRLGFTRELDAVKIEADLMKLVPREQWGILSHWLIWHGRRRCMARNPDCEHCEVLKLCPRIGVATAPKARVGKKTT
jgi:endonuclease III